MNVVDYYINQGAYPEEFDVVDNKLIPAKSFPMKKLPRLNIIDVTYELPLWIEKNPHYHVLKKKALEWMWYEALIPHLEYMNGSEITFKPLRYMHRSIFTVFIDKELRDAISPFPFIDGKLDINRYPLPKPVGVHLFLIDKNGRIILQERGNLGFDGNTISSSAGGAVEWKDVLLYEDYCAKGTAIEEAEEEVGIKRDCITDMKFAGMFVNYRYLLNFDYVYVARANCVVENVHNKEVGRIHFIDAGLQDPEDLFGNGNIILNYVKKKKLKPATTLLAAIALFNKL